MHLLALGSTTFAFVLASRYRFEHPSPTFHRQPPEGGVKNGNGESISVIVLATGKRRCTKTEIKKERVAKIELPPSSRGLPPVFPAIFPSNISIVSHCSCYLFGLSQPRSLFLSYEPVAWTCEKIESRNVPTHRERFLSAGRFFAFAASQNRLNKYLTSFPLRLQ